MRDVDDMVGVLADVRDGMGLDKTTAVFAHLSSVVVSCLGGWSRGELHPADRYARPCAVCVCYVPLLYVRLNAYMQSWLMMMTIELCCVHAPL